MGRPPGPPAKQSSLTEFDASAARTPKASRGRSPNPLKVTDALTLTVAGEQTASLAGFVSLPVPPGHLHPAGREQLLGNSEIARASSAAGAASYAARSPHAPLIAVPKNLVLKARYHRGSHFLDAKAQRDPKRSVQSEERRTTSACLIIPNISGFITAWRSARLAQPSMSANSCATQRTQR